jgi:hypothetical protein
LNHGLEITLDDAERPRRQFRRGIDVLVTGLSRVRT